ncbi:MAG: glycosyltransferase family 2 protein [Nitrospinota bacterium]
MGRREHSSGGMVEAADTDPGISTIIITRNRREILREALAHLIRSGQGKGIDEIILVDNGSTDGTSGMIEAQFPEIQLIRLPRNLGIPEARNIGALNASRELLLFLDDDGAFDCSCLPYIAQFLYENERLAVVACDVIEIKDGEAHVQSSELEAGSWKKGQTGEGSGGMDVPLSYEPRAMSLLAEGEAPTIQPTYTFYGGAAMLKRSAFLEAGMFPGHFFYSHEEDDLSFRLIAKGYRLALCPEAIFVHYRFTGERPNSRKSKIFHYYRNRQWVIWRNLPWQAAIRESWATLIGGAVRTIFTPYFPAFLAGSAAALAELIRIICSERSPLSQEQYGRYRELDRELMGYRHRLGDLLLDLRQGRRLDWI